MGRGKRDTGNRDMDVAKAGYKDAEDRGDREEQAKWANQIGHLHKNKGEYVEALKWFRLDYDISYKHLPQKQLMPTCQSIGEMYLRLQKFDDALKYQEKHLKFAQEANDLVEQQRASTQLVRTYYDLYDQNDENYTVLEKAKKYLFMSMELARSLKDDPPDRYSPSFVKELVDAYNNMGLLKIYMEDYEEAEKVLLQGLRICDEEEVGDNEEGRTRLHHNLGRVYIEKREWEKAKEQFNIDIKICQSIPHPQGEAFGLINLGLIYYKTQNYERAMSNYNRALEIAYTLEDEDALVRTVKINIQTAEEAHSLFNELLQEEQKVKKLIRGVQTSRGTAMERRDLAKLHENLKTLIDHAVKIEAWSKHLEFAKKNKNIVKELGDAEKLCDALNEVGESYYNLRKFDKAKKWYTKSLNIGKSIGNIEGQAVAKINLGSTLDSIGRWKEALQAYKEGYRIALEGKVLSLQLTGLNNMHYSYTRHFHNHEEARRLEPEIEKLKKSIDERDEEKESERCPETDSDEENSADILGSDKYEDPLANLSTQCLSPVRQEPVQPMDCSYSQIENTISIDDDIPLAMYIHSQKESQKRTNCQNKASKIGKVRENNNVHREKGTDMSLENDTVNEVLAGRKRPRVIISDDDETDVDMDVHPCAELDNTVDNTFIANNGNPEFSKAGLSESRNKETIQESPEHVGKDLSADTLEGLNAIPSEISQYMLPNYDCAMERHAGHFDTVHSGRKHERFITVQIDKTTVVVEAKDMDECPIKSVDWLIKEAVHLFCLQNYRNKTLTGMKPIIHQILYKSRVFDSNELLEELLSNLNSQGTVTAIVKGWVQIGLVDRYLIFCKDFCQSPSSKLLSKLHGLKVSQDIIIASDCELEDQSVLPLLKAISEDGAFSHLDLSHNALGNQSVHKIQEAIAASSKSNVGLTLDLHDNQLGASALLQISGCPVALSRIEVLNLSKNHLTDAAGRILSSCIKGCKALASLNLEECGLSGRTIKLIGNSLPPDSELQKLSIGKNNPIPGTAMTVLLEKLSCLAGFEDLDLSNMELDKMAVESLCNLLKSSSSISALEIGGTSIGVEGAMKLSEVLVTRAMPLTTLDLSFCVSGVSSFRISRFCIQFLRVEGLVRLNLSGNLLKKKGAALLGNLLSKARHLRILTLNRCQLGYVGIVNIIQGVSEESSLQELFLAGNIFEQNKAISSTINASDDCCLEEAANASKCNKEGGDNIIQMETKTEAESERIANMIIKSKQPECTEPKKHNMHLGGEPQCKKRPPINCEDYYVADSEDEDRTMVAECPSHDHDCASSSHSLEHFHKISHRLAPSKSKGMSTTDDDDVTQVPSTEFKAELSVAIRMARSLQLLDLSDNAFSIELIEHLFSEWKGSRISSKATRHTENQIVHFKLEGKQCCGSRPCCSTSGFYYS